MQRGQNTMAEGLTAILSDLAGLKPLPDADLQFLTEMETMILGKLQAPVNAMAGANSGGMPGPPGVDMSQGPVPGMGPGSTPPMPPPGLPMGGPGGPPPGVAPRPNMAGAPDELRRMLSNPGAAG
jgi:hypothetical protein